MVKINWLTYIFVMLMLPSCEFNCSIGKIGDAADTKDTVASTIDTRILNAIQLKTYKVKVSRAYLSFKDGTLVPGNNVVDFTRPVVVQLEIDKGWIEENRKSYLGVAEKITTESGSVLLDEKDLFGGKRYEEGISATDAKVITISANISLPENTPPTSFTISFRVWDKKGDGYIEGDYKLYSK